jgi:hypothetical protein
MQFQSNLLKRAMPPLPDHMKDKTFYHGAGLSEDDDSWRGLSAIKGFVTKGIVPNFGGGNYGGLYSAHMEAMRGRTYLTPDYGVALDYAQDTYGIILEVSGHDLVKDVLPDEDSLLRLIEELILRPSYPPNGTPPEARKLIEIVNSQPYAVRQRLITGDPQSGSSDAKKLMKKLPEDVLLWIIQHDDANIAYKGRVKPTKIYLVEAPGRPSLKELLWSREGGFTPAYKELMESEISPDYSERARKKHEKKKKKKEMQTASEK